MLWPVQRWKPCITFFNGLWLNWSSLYLWAHLSPKGTGRLPQPQSVAQQLKAVVPKPEGGVSVQGALMCPFLNLRRKQYQLRWIPCKSMWAILNEFITVILRDVQRDLPPPKQPYALMCAEPICTQNCPVPHVPILFSTLTPSNAMASKCIPLILRPHLKSVIINMSSRKSGVL